MIDSHPKLQTFGTNPQRHRDLRLKKRTGRGREAHLRFTEQQHQAANGDLTQ